MKLKEFVKAFPRRTIKAIVLILPQGICEGLVDLLSSRIHYPVTLLFHSVESTVTKSYTVSQEYFRSVVSYLAKRDYQFLFENQFAKKVGKTVILSFDDGFTNNLQYAYPVCKHFNAKMSINIVADRIDASEEFLSANQIEEMLESQLVQFQCHTKTHVSLTDCDEDQLQVEIIDAKRLIREKTNIECDCFVYPRGRSTMRATELVSSAYKFAFGGGGYSRCYRMMHIRREELSERDDERKLTRRILFNLLYHFFYL